MPIEEILAMLEMVVNNCNAKFFGGGENDGKRKVEGLLFSITKLGFFLHQPLI